MKPFLKWAGGKRQILELILDKIHDSTKCENKEAYRFIEPFVGGGVVFLALKNENTIINDLNFELIKTYEIIRDQPEQLMERLDEYYRLFVENGEDFYYQIRQMDRNDDFKNLPALEIAARMIFLNKTCYNGLYRVNSLGYFNTPIGRNHIKSFYDKNNILSISNYLRGESIRILNDSYEIAMEEAGMGDVIYLDPPYDYKEDDGFTKYQKNGFSFNDFLKLKEECDKALERGAYVIISNNYTPKVVNEFKKDKQHNYELYDVMSLATKRSINCKGDLRNNGEEILIWGIPCAFPHTENVESLFPFIKIRNKNSISDYDYLNKRFKQYSHKAILRMLSSLKFLKILDYNNEFTPKGIELRKYKLGSEEFNRCFAEIIVNHPLFVPYIYNANARGLRTLTTEEIRILLIQLNPGISENLARKRSEIVDVWIRWANNILY